MTAATTYYLLFQGEIDSEEPADVIGGFSTEARAWQFAKSLSDEHTELKRAANDARQNRLEAEDVPDLYWDVRPVAFDPRNAGELL